MELTIEQKSEIGDVISAATKYRETYNEVYDHIVNVIVDSDQNYSSDLICRILINDFGGAEEIFTQEKIYAKNMTRKYFSLFKGEILNTFKWPDITANLSLMLIWLCIYTSSLRMGFNAKPMTTGMWVIVISIELYYYYKRYYLDRNQRKPSAKYSFLQAATSWGSSFYVFIFYSFIAKDSLLDISVNSKTIITITLFCCISIYLRAFIKLYRKKIKVLTV